MTIDRATVAKIANLARIEVTDQDLDYYGPQLQNILKWFEMMNEVDTSNVEPLASVSDIALKLRKDEVIDGDKVADILANAPEAVEGFFVVPKIVE